MTLHTPFNNACELCGAALRSAFHQDKPVERWLCDGCGKKEMGFPGVNGRFFSEQEFKRLDDKTLADQRTSPRT